jgi:glucosylceramidase
MQVLKQSLSFRRVNRLDPIGGPNHLGNMCDAPLLAVPYRVSHDHNVSQLPDFEHEDYPFGPVVGDSRTREELNSMGMPAKYLDRGVVVQPMFYYMGHISRHIRPGSKAVLAIVDQAESGATSSRTFQIKSGDSLLAGGGINDLARDGVEVTLWPCEGSTRQEWLLNDNRQLQVFGHDWKGKATTSCLGKKPDTSFEGLTLSPCDDNAATLQVNYLNETLALTNIIVENSEAVEGKKCIIALPLKSNGGAYGPRGGAQITLGNCDQESVSKMFDCINFLFTLC